MSETGAGSPALRQLLWIAAGVAALTLLVVAASWLFSPRPIPGEAGEGRVAAPIKEDHIQRQTFAPETPAAGSGRSPATPAPSVPPVAAYAEPAQEPATSMEPPVEEPMAIHPGTPPATFRPETYAPAKHDAPAPKPEAKPTAPASAGRFGVQVGAFGEIAKAKEIAARLESNHYKATILTRDGKYKVLATGFPDRASAEKAQAALSKAGIKDPFIVPLE